MEEDRPRKRGRKPFHTPESKRTAWNEYQREYYARKRNKYEQFKDVKLSDIKLILKENEKIEKELNRLKNENTDLNDIVTQSKSIIKDLITENNKLKVIAVKQKHLLQK